MFLILEGMAFLLRNNYLQLHGLKINTLSQYMMIFVVFFLKEELFIEVYLIYNAVLVLLMLKTLKPILTYNL